MNSNKNNLPFTINGLPNLNNPSVLAGILDCAGMNLTMTLNDIGSRGNALHPNDPDAHLTITATEAHILVSVQKLLRMMRDAVGEQHDLPSSQVDVCFTVLNEIDAFRAQAIADLDASEQRILELAKQMGLEREARDFIQSKRAEHKIPPRKTSAADAADAILRDLRESGTIGGTRAV